jgi:hypothetical protein
VSEPKPAVPAAPGGSNAVRIGLAWLFVSIPLAWGVFETLRKAAQLFQ